MDWTRRAAWRGAGLASMAAGSRRLLSSQRLAQSQLLVQAAYVDGKWMSKSGNGETFLVVDPGTGQQVARLPEMDEEECAHAIGVAHEALKSWRKTTGKERCEILRDVFLQHREHADELAEILSAESGKPLAEAKGEIMYGASYFEWFAEEAKRSYGDVIPEPVPGRKVLTWREPVGVCALITPWNFPNAMIARKAAPALAAGCTVVVRPSSLTPMSTLAIAKMFERAGLPAGVLNVVTSDARTKELGKLLCTDPRVRKVSFTGSTTVGKILMKDCVDTVKKVSMELGGDAPFIVFDDADLDAAVEGLVMCKFRNCGQTCVSANRVFVQRGVYDAFSRRLAERVGQLKVGHYSEPGVQVGPLISERAASNVIGLIKDATENGARVLAGGEVSPGHATSAFVLPTVIADCSRDMRVAQQEIFGPIIALQVFDTETEVLDRANDTEAGLAAYFFSSDLKRCFRVAQGLEAGMVGCNTGIISTEVAPFGGIKQSGLGREGSKYGLEDYTELKYMALQIQ